MTHPLVVRAIERGLISKALGDCIDAMLKQGASLEQACIGTQWLSKEQFIDLYGELGVTEELLHWHQDEMVDEQKKTIHARIDGLLTRAEQERSRVLAFYPLQKMVLVFVGDVQTEVLSVADYSIVRMKLERWAKRLGWMVTKQPMQSHEALILVREQNDERYLTIEQRDVLSRLKAGDSGLYHFSSLDRYLDVHHLSSLDDEKKMQELNQESLHRLALGDVLAYLAPTLHDELASRLEKASIPVYTI